MSMRNLVLRILGFKWVSSTDEANADSLAELDAHLAHLYGDQDSRSRYQDMLNHEDEQPPADSVRHALPGWVAHAGCKKVLEIGCGNGRLYRQVRRLGYEGEYWGIEPAPQLIEANRRRHPEANWRTANAYHLPFDDQEFDLCCSLFVIEHLVYPERALLEMMRVVRTGGSAAIVFPDFVCKRHLPSQLTGLTPGGAAQKLRQLRLLDALLGLLDSRIRVPWALQKLQLAVGPFPVNLAPIALRFGAISPDTDAVYIASKREVQDWATRHRFDVSLPCGKDGQFADHAFMVLRR